MANLTDALRPFDTRAALTAVVLLTVCLAAGLVAGPKAVVGVAALALAASAGAMILFVQADRPALGILLLLLTSVLLPLDFPGPSGARISTSLPIAAGLCGVWLVRLIALPGTTRVEQSRLVTSLLVLMAVSVASFLYGLVPMFPSGGAPLPAQIAQLALFLVSGCLLLVAANQITSEAQVRWIAFGFVAAGTIAALTLIVPPLGSIAAVTTRPQSMGSLFWTWLVAISASQAMFNRRLGGLTRLVLLGVTVLVLWHGLVQVRSWASGWLPPLVVLGALLMLRLPRLTIGLGLVGVPVALLTYAYLSDAVMADESYSLMTRQEAWRVLWNIVMRSPLVGSGMANYYYYTENFPILGWYVRFISHNNYQDLLVQTGFLGVVAFAWFGLEAVLYALVSFRSMRSGFARAHAAGVSAGIAGSLASGMLGDWFLPFYYNAGILGFRSSLLFWLFIGTLVALKRTGAADADGPAGLPRMAAAVR